MTSPTVPDKTCQIQATGGRCEMDENLEILRNIQAFSCIPMDRLRLYAYLSKRMHFKEGEFVFRHGDSDDKGYIIISGRVQVIREYQDRSLLLGEFQEGDFFGGLALLSDIKRLFSVKALTDTHCLTIDRESFRKIMIQFPEIAARVLDVMIKRIVIMEERLLQAQLDQIVYG